MALAADTRAAGARPVLGREPNLPRLGHAAHQWSRELWPIVGFDRACRRSGIRQKRGHGWLSRIRDRPLSVLTSRKIYWNAAGSSNGRTGHSSSDFGLPL